MGWGNVERGKTPSKSVKPRDPPLQLITGATLRYRYDATSSSVILLDNTTSSLRGARSHENHPARSRWWPWSSRWAAFRAQADADAIHTLACGSPQEFPTLISGAPRMKPQDKRLCLSRASQLQRTKMNSTPLGTPV